MDRNLIGAFALLFGAIIFFNSDFYNYTMLKKERPNPERMRFIQDSLRSAVAEKAAAEKAASTAQVPAPVPGAGEGQSVSSAPAGTDTLSGSARTITVIGTHFIGRISTRGAVAVEWYMRDYKNSDSSIINVIPSRAGGALNLIVGERNFDYSPFICDRPDTVRLEGKDTVVFSCASGAEGLVEKVFVFNRDSYDFQLIIRAKNAGTREYALGWKAGLVETEKNIDAKWGDNPINVFFGDDVDQPVDKDEAKKDVEGFIKWVSLKTKYFFCAVIPSEPRDMTVRFAQLGQTPDSRNPLNFSFEIPGKMETGEERYTIVICPNKYSTLKSFDAKLEKTLFKGYAWFFKADVWFPPLCGLTLAILNYFYHLIPNYGVAILLLTLLSKVVTYPLTIKSTQSMARMKLLAPKMTEIREKYKSDPMAMNKAMMALYREEGVNPLGAGGCLPMILQMPIFIALFVTLRKSIELRGAPFMGWITDLSGPEVLYTLPFSIPFYGNNLSLLTIIMAVTMYFQSKQTMTDPKQKAMIYMMPIMMLFMFNNMPAGLVLYWAMSNILTIAQNVLIKPDPAKLAAKPKKKSMFKRPSYNEMLKKMGKR